MPSKKVRCGVLQSISYDSAFAQIGDIVESDQSVNPISTPFVSSHTLMASDKRNNNRDNEFNRLPPLYGHLGHENVENELDRPRPLRERLVPERTLAPSCIRILAYPGTFHFRNKMIAMLTQFHKLKTK